MRSVRDIGVTWSNPEIHALDERLSKLGLELRGASRVNDMYKFRLSPLGQKLVLAHFNTLEEINMYLDDLQTATIGE